MDLECTYKVKHKSVIELYHLFSKDVETMTNIQMITKIYARIRQGEHIEEIQYLNKEKELCFKYYDYKNLNYLLVNQKDIEKILNIEIISITNLSNTTNDISKYTVTYKEFEHI